MNSKNTYKRCRNRIDIMVDLETLGTGNDCTVFQIGAIAFDINTGKYIKTFNLISDITLDNDFKVEPKTLMWWLKTDKELLLNLLDNNDNIPSYNMFYQFYYWLQDLKNEYENVYLWGNGILFDNKIIENKLAVYGLEYPIFFRNDRDLRTIIELTITRLDITEKELKQIFENKTLTKHNALDDVKYQIQILVYCWDIITNIQSIHVNKIY